MKTVDIRGRHDVGEIISLGLRVYLPNAGAMLPIALLTVPLGMLAAVIPSSGGSAAAGAILQIAFLVASIIVGAVANGALIHAVNEVAGGTRPEFARSVDAGIERVGALVSTMVLEYALIVLSLIAAPYFFVRWEFSPQGVMIEGKRNWAALDVSSSIVKGQWWRTLGILLLSALIAVGPIIVAAGIAIALPALAAATVQGIGFALVLPFIIAAQTILYYDLRARREEAMAAAHGAAPTLDADPGDDERP